MSVAAQKMIQQEFRLEDQNGQEIHLMVKGNFVSDYSAPVLVENTNYFKKYLIDSGGVFGDSFQGIKQIQIEDIKRLNFRLVSYELKYAPPDEFPGLPWFEGQKKVYLLIDADSGFKQGMTEYNKVPEKVNIKYDIKKQCFILEGSSVSPKGYEKYEVED